MVFTYDELQEYSKSFKNGILNPHMEQKFINHIVLIKYYISHEGKEKKGAKDFEKFVSSILECPQAKKYEQYIKEVELKIEKQIKLKKEKEKSINNSYSNKGLYDELMLFCNSTVNNYNCSCGKQIDISMCEQQYSRKCKKYDCYVLPFMYFLKRADRHCSELIYAFKSTEKILSTMSKYNILELGCGPAMSLIAIDYFNKKYYNKSINYTGIDINKYWNPLFDKLKIDAKTNLNINSIKILQDDITQELNFHKKFNIVVLNYVISWFAENNQYESISKIFLNAIKSIDSNKTSIIIINDVNQDFKGVNEFIQIENILEKYEIKYNIIKKNLNGRNTIFQDYWGENNKCTSAQLIITIGGKDDN